MKAILGRKSTTIVFDSSIGSCKIGYMAGGGGMVKIFEGALGEDK